MKVVVRALRELYAEKPVAEFGPLCVKAARQRWVNEKRSRTECNRRVAMIKRILKWAVSEELAPPAVYQACVAYNSGIGQQVHNQNQLKSIQSQIKNTVAQINAIDQMIAGLKNQIAAQEALIARTQAAIDDLGRKIRFGEAALVPLEAHATIRDQLLNERLRYIDSHGSMNYIQLVLTSNSMNQLMNRLVGAHNSLPETTFGTVYTNRCVCAQDYSSRSHGCRPCAPVCRTTNRPCRKLT